MEFYRDAKKSLEDLFSILDRDLTHSYLFPEDVSELRSEKVRGLQNAIILQKNCRKFHMLFRQKPLY